MTKKFIHFLAFFAFAIAISAQQPEAGALQTREYLPLLQGKKVGLVANHTSILNKDLHLLDFLLQENIQVIRLFTPEHGLRGEADAGEKVGDGKDSKTGLPIVSLYGKNKKPSPEQMQGIDVVVFDLQDVGVRFYTYISTLAYVMEACAEAHIPIIVLDRPNPNAWYVAGPIRQDAKKSFVGLHPVPVVYGMSIGEYGLMVNGEGWLSKGLRANITVVKCKHYTRQKDIELPVPPSPNLRSARAIRLYPSLCFFEGTSISVGRGTDRPFEVFGSPTATFKQVGQFTFVPQSSTGAKNPLHQGQTCYGFDLAVFADSFMMNYDNLYLDWLIESFKLWPDPGKFFNNFFDLLAGTPQLRLDIMAGKTAEEIQNSWTDELNEFKRTRKKYLLYPDFER